VAPVLLVVASSSNPESFALFQIMPRGTVNFTPLLYVIGTLKRPLLLLLWRLLVTVSTVSSVLAITPISYVNLAIILLPWGPLAPGFQKSHLGLRSLYTYVGDYERIDHCLQLLHGKLLHSLDVADPITESIDDLDVIDVWDNVSGVVESFHIILKTFIMLLPDGLQSLRCRWMLIHALEIPNEHSTKLVPQSDRSFG
jgi:hypothetical protein